MFINDLFGDIFIYVLLVEFDMVYGCWNGDVIYDENSIMICGYKIFFCCEVLLVDLFLVSVDLVVECFGKFKIFEVL